MKFTVSLLPAFVFGITLLGCSPSKQEVSPLKQTPTQGEIFSGFDIQLEGNTDSFAHQIDKKEIENGIAIYTLKLEANEAIVPEKMSLHWRIPATDIAGQWTTNSRSQKFLYPEWSGAAGITSRAADQAPVFTLYSSTDQNRITFACSDALNTVTLRAGVKEEDGFFDCEVILFKEKIPPFESYEVEILVDTRAIHFNESLSDVANWWAGMPKYKPSKVPEHARLPMYSTWYSFHQQLDEDAVVEQCRLAKELGYEAVIVDDGWQTKDNSRGYAFTGDWQPERFADFKGFVQKIHDLNMKFILWYSIPDMGIKAKNMERFKNKSLAFSGGKWGGSYTMDPRYPEVREYLINLYENAIKDWNIDGFKLDFIDQFTAKKDTKLTKEDGRDYASVNDAVDRLMTDITSRLKALNPEVLIEFRQRYIGPLMRKYGNMFRAGDCPDSYHYNRLRTTDLRLLSGNTAVHSDMVMWHPEEPVESAALQLLHILYSVPQLSVKIDKIPEDHKEMIRFWNSYWRENRDVLLDGKFQASNPAMNYTMLSATSVDKRIIGVYSNEIIDISGSPKQIDLVNGKLLSGIVVNVSDDLVGLSYELLDCKGNNTGTGSLVKGIQVLDVPAAGLIQVKE